MALVHFDRTLARDELYVLPLLRAALNTSTTALRLFSAPWSPPKWMKKPFPTPSSAPAMDVSAPDGLLPAARGAWAKYFSLWHTAMAAHGAPFWGYSIQNEPLAHGHMWDCCGYTLGNYTAFARDFVMPVMKRDHPELKLLLFDHNPDSVALWAGTALNDTALGSYAWGTAVHWYSDLSQRGVQLNNTHKAHPNKPILHTEGCVCRDIPLPDRSWAWWKVGEDYGVGLFQFLQNWAVGFTDWNLMLDLSGGPYHDRPFGCNAPIQTNGSAGFVIQAPYYFMAHFSRFLPPTSTVLGAMAYAGSAAPAPPGRFWYDADADGSSPGQLAVLGARRANGTNVLVVMNTEDKPKHYRLKAARGVAPMRIPAHGIQTLEWD